MADDILPDKPPPGPLPNWLAGPQPTRLPAQLLLAAGVLLVVGVMLPWVQVSSPFGGFSRSGFSWSSDGKILAAIGVALAAIGIAVLNQARQLFWQPALVAAVVAGGMAFYALGEAEDRIESADSELLIADIGNGIYLSLGAAALGIIAGFMLRRAEQQRS